MDLNTVIRQFVIENFLFGEDGQLRDETSFLESGIIDSTGILELVSFLEEKFGIAVADEELVPENLDSISNVVAYLTSKTGSAGLTE
jgi:acyl carrier protein